MKVNTPKSRYHLKIDKNAHVLEVGGGHNPHPRANVVVDKFVNDNSHRSGNVKIRSNQIFMEADGENLPFDDNEFDYIISCHVLEHVNDPEKFLKEHMRVARRGYLEVPSLIGEYLAPKKSHVWTALDIDNTLLIEKKSKISFDSIKQDFGDLFIYHMQKQSIAYKILMRDFNNLMTVRIEWQDDLKYIVEPKEAELQSYFDEPWGIEKIRKLFPEKRTRDEFVDFMFSLFAIGSNFLTSRFKSNYSKVDVKIRA